MPQSGLEVGQRLVLCLLLTPSSHPSQARGFYPLEAQETYIKNK